MGEPISNFHDYGRKSQHWMTVTNKNHMPKLFKWMPKLRLLNPTKTSDSWWEMLAGVGSTNIFCWREKMSAMERPSKPPTRSIPRYKVSSCRGIGFDERHFRFVESFLTLPTEIANPTKHSKCLTNFPTFLQEKSQDTAPRLRSCHIFFSLWRCEATPRLRQVGLCVPPRRTGRWCR